MSGSSVLTLLPWIIPPLLGALIGYITNALAIKMLFRPLTEKYILGIKIPLTPGIIPKQRYVLAESIGRMVSERLITSETLQKQIDSHGFQSGIRENVATITRQLLDTPLSLLNGSGRQNSGNPFNSFLAEVLRNFVASRSFNSLLGASLNGIIGVFLGKPIAYLLDNRDLRKLAAERFEKLLSENSFKEWLTEALKAWIIDMRNQNTPLSAFIAEDLILELTRILQILLPKALDSLVEWLRKDTIKVDMAIRGRFLLKDIFEKFTGLQKFFISVGQYDRTIDEKMPEIIEDVILNLEQSLHEPELQTTLLVSMTEALHAVRKMGLHDLEKAFHLDLVKEVVNITAMATAYLQSEQGKKRVIVALRSYLQSHREKTIGELLGTLSSQNKEDFTLLIDPILDYFTGNRATNKISDNILLVLRNFLNKSSIATVSDLIILGDNKKKMFDSYLSLKFSEILGDRLPVLLKSFDIKELVVNKINQLDVAQVESLLLMVIAKHLKWINIFGAVLGALIGFSQVLLKYLGFF